jgi:hypothetical protein
MFLSLLRHPLEQFLAARDIPDESNGLAHHQRGIIHFARLSCFPNPLARQEGDQFLKSATPLLDGKHFLQNFRL